MQPQARNEESPQLGKPLWLPAPGELIANRFLIDALAATGGMGAVFRARDVSNGEPVAIKFVRLTHELALERFAREAQVLSELHHPAIVRYIAHGSTGRDGLYLAMEWLEGDDLARTLTRVQLSFTQTVALMRRICDGLALAHEHGIVHRDLKPSNLFVVGGDVTAVKILDFGLARRTSGGQTLTRGGGVLGTVGYMAPEQAMGMADIDARADVFSLGCVMFECLTGRAVFFAQHDVAVLAKVLRDEPPRASLLRPELGEPIDSLLARMLCKDREGRPRDARDVLSALEAAIKEAPPPPSISLPTVSRITTSERRVVSIILARAMVALQTLTRERAVRELTEIEELANRFEADLFPLQAGGLLLSLSGPDVATDQASRAASCALALKRLRPHLEVAVATGGLESTGFMPVGEAIDRAAALLDKHASAFGVILDELTHGLLNRRFDVQLTPTGALLIGELDEMDVPRLLLGRATPCVGRDKELVLLEATLEECVSDSVARCVLVTGMPGVGKSRLSQTFLDRLREKENVRPLVARAQAIAAGSALSLAERLIRRAAGLCNSDPTSLQRSRLRSYLSSLVEPEQLDVITELMAELVDLNEGQSLSPLVRAARHDPEIMHNQLRRAFEQWLSAESLRRAVVIILEDLHWADGPSVSYLEHALTQLHARPILVVALGRPEVRDRYPRLQRLGELQEIRLAGLTRRAAERLTRLVLPNESDASVARVVERADGNAFYLEELIRCVAEGSTDLPVTVLAMAQSRLDTLETDARRVLRALSVFGAVCSRRGVEALLGQDCDVAGWLEALTAREILIRRRDARMADDPEYEFRHALLRDAAYAMLTDSDRRVAHRIAGYWLEREGERDARVLADHFERGHAWESSICWLSRAALEALDAGDLDGALELARRGLERGASGERRGTLLLLQGYVAAFRTSADSASLEEALCLLARSSSHWWLALSTLLFGAMSSGRPDDALPYVQLALAAEPGRELTGAYGAALQTMCVAMVMIGQADLAWSVLERYDDASADEMRCDQAFVAWLDLARCQLATTAPYRGVWQLEKALNWARSGTAAMRALGSSHGVATALFYLGYASRIVGQYEEAERALEESVRCAASSGVRLVDQYAKLILVAIKLHTAAFDEASKMLTELSYSGDATVAHGAQAMTAEAHYRRDEFADARDHALLAVSGPSSPYRRVAFSTLARAQMALGEPMAALGTVERALSEPTSATPEYAIDLLATRAQAAQALGDDAMASEAHEESIRLIETVAASIEHAPLRTAFLTQHEANVRALAFETTERVSH